VRVVCVCACARACVCTCVCVRVCVCACVILKLSLGALAKLRRAAVNFVMFGFMFVLCFLLGNSPESELYIPTFRNTLYVPSLWAGRCVGSTPTCL